jgi:hypothetical protein
VDEEKRVESFIDLYKQQMEHYHHTQDVEWKGNFGVWTLLVGAIYLAKERFISVTLHCAVAILVAAVGVHALWLCMVLRSEQTDKMLWVRYRGEALKLLRGAETQRDEQRWERGAWTLTAWLVSEVGVTCLLCLVFLYLSTRS